MKKVAFLAVAVSAFALANPAAAQVTPDSESLTLNLSGTVNSDCELVPDGPSDVSIDMLNPGNQAPFVILYSCNSPYTVSLSSLNGGMSHAESGGAVNIDYNVEATGFAPGTTTSTNSDDMHGTPVTIVTNTDWQNILLNGGLRAGNLDLDFDSLAEYAVAGTYSDELTITLAAQL